MDGLDVFFLVGDFVQANKSQRELTLENFNHILNISNSDLKKSIYGTPNSPLGYGTSQHSIDSLSPFKTSSTITLSSGIGTLPDDYWHKIVMEVSSNGVMVDFVSEQERQRRVNCSIDNPTIAYPIAEVINATQFKVYPTDITSVILTYLKNDTPKIIVGTDANHDTYTVFQNLLWKQEQYTDLIRIILGYLNIPVTNEQVLSYVEQKTQKENVA